MSNLANPMSATQSLARMSSIVRADVETLTLATKMYAGLRAAGKGAKRAHAATATAFDWSFATWAQNLVDVQRVSL